MTVDSPPNGGAAPGRIWSKLPASHWASTLSNDSVYVTQHCAKNEFVYKTQLIAGNCRCNQRPSLSWLEHGSSDDAFASSSGSIGTSAATHDLRLRRRINLQGWWSWPAPYLFIEPLE